VATIKFQSNETLILLQPVLKQGHKRVLPGVRPLP
jgi:hypothetical protein